MFHRASDLERAFLVLAGFTDRHTPVPSSPDHGGRVEDLGLALDRMGLPGAEVAACHQVHGARVFRVWGPAWPAGDGDALVTTVPGLVLGVRTADCVPVLLAGPGGVAAVHAGWRGTAAGVVHAAVEALSAATGQPAGAFRAALGPAVGPCCYAVGPEVVDALAHVAPPEVFVASTGVDLRAVVLHVLASLGVAARIAVPACTACDERFHSWRRDGRAAGRQAALVALRP
ncbi:MAG: laccase domain-containing protein [Deltaproteobacteria bacterium]|nr:laccase domain-containing protein [Deltaproteobacteria bacterium]